VHQTQVFCAPLDHIKNTILLSLTLDQKTSWLSLSLSLLLWWGLVWEMKILSIDGKV